MAASKKYRDALRHGRVAFVVDDVQPPWKPRMLEIRGSVEGATDGGEQINPGLPPEILRITPTRIISFGLTGDIAPHEGRVDYSSRKFD
jgi:pyridoxamine 5'-phosphate oxidase family protein